MSSWIPKDLHIHNKFRKYKNKLLRGGRQHKAVTTMDTPKSMLMSLVFTKGLSNNAGENNCFLNSAVQILWHLDVFRRNFNMLSHHACLENSCIFCALKVIFIQFQHSEEKVLPPVALRQALAVAFENQQKFQLGLMDDAAECFENILTRIHFHLSNGDMGDNCTLPHCISHQKFAMMLIEQVVCECGETSEPLPFVQLVHYVAVHAIVNLSQKHKATKSFGHVLRLARSEGNLRNKCPSKCDRQAHVERTLTNVPDVISIGLIWDSDEQSTHHIKNFFEAIGTELHLGDMFDSVVDAERVHAACEHKLVGMVCYYGKHYSAFLLHSKSNCWKSCDDATVTDIGPNWSDVVEKCSRGRYQPLLLLYQNPNALGICLKSIPMKTTFLPNDSKLTEASDEDSGSCASDAKTSDQSRQSVAKKCGAGSKDLPPSDENCNINNNSSVDALNGIDFSRGPTVTPTAPPAAFCGSGLKLSGTRPTEPPGRLLTKPAKPNIATPRPYVKPSEPSNLPTRHEPPKPMQSGSSHSLPRSSDSETKCLSSQTLANSNKTDSHSCIPSLLPQYPLPVLHQRQMLLNAGHIAENTSNVLNSPGRNLNPIVGNRNTLAGYQPRYEVLPNQQSYVVYNGGPGPLNCLPYQPGTVPPVISSHEPAFSSNFSGLATVPNSTYGVQMGLFATPLPQQPLAPPSGYGQTYYGGCTSVVVPSAGANLQAAPVPYTPVTNQLDNAGGDYGKAGNQLNVHVLNEGRLTGDAAQPKAPSSEMNLMDWSIIDEMLPSPDSDSTSSQYDNLLDLLSIDDKTSCQATLSAKGIPLVVRNKSLTESYFIVPDAQHLGDMANDKDLTKEADQLIEQSEAKEKCGDLHAALICCNQATNLYVMARKESSNHPGTGGDLGLKEKLAHSRSKRLLQQIDFNQLKSKTDAKNKFSGMTGIPYQTPTSPTTTRRDQDLLIFLEDPSKPSLTPQYQAVKDNLQQLYRQNYRGPQYHWVSK